MLETGIGRAANVALASLPNFKLPGDISASDRYWKEDIVEPAFTLNNRWNVECANRAGHRRCGEGRYVGEGDACQRDVSRGKEASDGVSGAAQRGVIGY